MDLAALPDVSAADNHLRRARRVHVDGARVRGRVRGAWAVRAEAQVVRVDAGVAVRCRHDATGPDRSLVRGAVTPGERPVIRTGVRRVGDDDPRAEGNRLAGLRPEVGAYVDLGYAANRRPTAVALARDGPHGQRRHHAQHRYTFVSHVVLSKSIKARASEASGGSRNRLRPPTQAAMVASVRPMIRTSNCSEAWRTYTTSRVTLSGRRRSAYAASGSPCASSASPCV